MSRLLLEGEPPIDVALRRSARARRLSLRISQLDGRVTLTLPKHVSDAEGRAFAEEKRDWIAKHLTDRPTQHSVSLNSKVPVLGKLHHVQAGIGRKIIMKDGIVFVPGAAQTVPRRVQAYLKALARDRLANASDYYAAKVGKSYSKISMRDTRSRWGSCSSSGTLMYSWRLVMAPADVLEYVAAHEVAHLVHMDHSDAFWGVVQDIFGNYSKQRNWLRTEGLGLHAYRFEVAP